MGCRPMVSFGELNKSAASSRPGRRLERLRLVVLAALLSTSATYVSRAFGQAGSPSKVDRSVTGRSAYALAIDPRRVGSYAALSKSGGGYFYDDVLEYRVWMHPERGGSDYFAAFAQFEVAEAFAKTTRGAEAPLVLIRQIEWVDEPTPGRYMPKKGERITEWQVQWLSDGKRTASSIPTFMADPRKRRN